MSLDAEYDDLDRRRVFVDWKAEMDSPSAPNNGSFGTVYEGKFFESDDVVVDVMVKVSVRLASGQSSSDLNDTLRCVCSLLQKTRIILKRCCEHCYRLTIPCRYEAELLRQLHFTPLNHPRDKPPHIIFCKFFCNYSQDLHNLYQRDEKFSEFWDARGRPEPKPDAVFFLVLPKLHTKSLHQLQVDSYRKAKGKKVPVGMREPLVWEIAGQVSHVPASRAVFEMWPSH